MINDDFNTLLNSIAVPPSHCAVAVSGGSDSMALLLLLQGWLRHNSKVQLTVLTVDHMLRTDSHKDAKFVKQYCERNNINCYILSDSASESQGNLQAYARELRYRLMFSFCQENNIETLFLGHNRDDQIETFYMHLDRGSGIDGLAAMDMISWQQDIRLIRPLLSLSKAGLRKLLVSKKIKWIEDSSNIKYCRGEYRSQLADVSELHKERIILTTIHMQRTKRAIMFYLRHAFDCCVKPDKHGYLRISLSYFNSLPEETSMRVLMYSLMIVGGKRTKPRFSSLSQIFYSVYKQNNIENMTLLGCRVVKHRTALLIVREARDIAALEVKVNQEILWDSRFRILVKSSSYDNLLVTTDKQRKNSGVRRCIRQSLPVLKHCNSIVAFIFSNDNNVSEIVDSCLEYDCAFIFKDLLKEVLQGIR